MINRKSEESRLFFNRKHTFQQMTKNENVSHRSAPQSIITIFFRPVSRRVSDSSILFSSLQWVIEKYLIEFGEILSFIYYYYSLYFRASCHIHLHIFYLIEYQVSVMCVNVSPDAHSTTTVHNILDGIAALCSSCRTWNLPPGDSPLNQYKEMAK